MIQYGSVANATNLTELRWQHRLIVVFAAEESQTDRDISSWVTSNQCRLADRDVLVLLVGDNNVNDLTAQNMSLDADSVAALKQRRNYPDAANEMLLIGKDGGTKASSTNLGKLDDFIERIDGMPMRQQEASNDKC